MTLKSKMICKGLFHSLLQFLLIFSFAWYNSCLFEMAIIYICFFYFRTRFEKQFHASTTWLCTAYTIIIFYIVSCVSPNKAISILLIIGFTYTINLISFYVRDYLDLRDKFKAKTVKITKGMSKDKLLEICEFNNLTELQTKIMIYFYCDRMSLTAISIKINYSYDFVAQTKSRIIRNIKLNNQI